MKKIWVNVISWLNHCLPLLAVLAVAGCVAWKNIAPTTIYSGWDNIHAEFNLGGYTQKVLFGAWLEHQGLGGPAAQGQLAEIPRLPILWLLSLTLPSNLIRSAYIFALYAVGGLGMYLYLNLIWLKNPIPTQSIPHPKNSTIIHSHHNSHHLGWFRPWLAGLGGILYLLHILTLQQFYISFEMFMVQFGLLPFLLLSIHYLISVETPATSLTHPANNPPVKARAWLLFVIVQLLIAPSAHTPTVFYLGALFSLLYSFWAALPQGFFTALKLSFLIGIVTLLANAYWLLPNFYFSLTTIQSVLESRDNQLFGPESLWSVREASTVSNFFSGTHYLFSWRDYSFAQHKFDFIFNDWSEHLSQPIVAWLLKIIGGITLVGAVTSLFSKNKASQRWTILITYFACAAFIWMQLFPTNIFFEYLYQSHSFLEAFRNPFTKLSIIYSFVSILLFIQAIEIVVALLRHFSLLNLVLLRRAKIIWPKPTLLGQLLAVLTIVLTTGAIIYTALPTFQGHFISEKLKIVYPAQYQQLFAYLQTRDQNLRVLPLPQLSHAGWEYYDWSFIKPGNGYQGMGFYFFGIPQPTLQRDFDRWVQTSDFFYHELKYALDSQNPTHLKSIFNKYQVDLAIVDETKITPAHPHDYTQDHKLLSQAGLKPVWHSNFLTVYERPAKLTDQELFVPNSLSMVAADAQRVRLDPAYQNEGNYLAVDQLTAQILYPLAQLLSHQLNGVSFSEQGVELTQTVPPGNYTLSLPGVASQTFAQAASSSATTYLTPVAITTQDKIIKVAFPEISLRLGEKTVTLPKIADFHVTVSPSVQPQLLLFNQVAIPIKPGTTIYPVIDFTIGQPITVATAQLPAKPKYAKSGELDGTQLNITPAQLIQPDWSALTQDLMVETGEVEQITLRSSFPAIQLNLNQNPSTNCADPQRGSIASTHSAGIFKYQADAFAVNCNAYHFDNESAAYSYIMNIKGKNLQGRGLKFFVNYSNQEVVPEDYLLSQREFNANLTLAAVSTNPKSSFRLDWETRSFGQMNKTELEQIQLAPFPLTQLAQLKLESEPSTGKTLNNLEWLTYTKLLEFVHIADVKCPQPKCYLGLDQSFDQGWLAWIVPSASGDDTAAIPSTIEQKQTGLTSRWHIKSLPHWRYNNWANVWEVPESGTVIIFYWPELMSLLSLSLVLALVVGLGMKARKSGIIRR